MEYTCWGLPSLSRMLCRLLFLEIIFQINCVQILFLGSTSMGIQNKRISFVLMVRTSPIPRSVACLWGGLLAFIPSPWPCHLPRPHVCFPPGLFWQWFPAPVISSHRFSTGSVSNLPIKNGAHHWTPSTRECQWLPIAHSRKAHYSAWHAKTPVS